MKMRPISTMAAVSVISIIVIALACIVTSGTDGKTTANEAVFLLILMVVCSGSVCITAQIVRRWL